MQELDDYIEKVKSLPPAPRILPELLGLLRQDDIDSSRVVDLISYDPGITAAVLRLCNSAFFAGATPAEDLKEAISRIGFRQVSMLVSAVSGSQFLGGARRSGGIDPSELWKHSVTAAVAAQMIAEDQGADAGPVFTAALLHDAGKIILAEALEHIYARLVEESQLNQTSLFETENRLLGVNHAQIGGRLLTRWKFPPNLVAAVAFHHQPADAGADQDVASYVHVGDLISYFVLGTYQADWFTSHGQPEARQILNLTPEALVEYSSKTIAKLESLEGLLNAA